MSYHTHAALSQSQLKVFLRSPREYEATYITGEISSEPSKAMDFGTLVHLALLEPEELQGAFSVRPDGLNANSKAYKEWKADQGDKIILTVDEAEALQAIMRSAMSHPIAKQFFAQSGYAEQPIFWVDADTELDLRAKPDLVLPDSHWVIDLKTTKDASPVAFGRTIDQHLYHLQAAMYLDGCCRIYGDGDWRWAWIVAQTEPPYRIRCYQPHPELLFDAGCLYRKSLASFADRKARNDWSDEGENELLPIKTWRQK